MKVSSLAPRRDSLTPQARLWRGAGFWRNICRPQTSTCIGMRYRETRKGSRAPLAVRWCSGCRVEPRPAPKSSSTLTAYATGAADGALRTNLFDGRMDMFIESLIALVFDSLAAILDGLGSFAEKFLSLFGI